MADGGGWVVGCAVVDVRGEGNVVADEVVDVTIRGIVVDDDEVPGAVELEVGALVSAATTWVTSLLPHAATKKGSAQNH